MNVVKKRQISWSVITMLLFWLTEEYQWHLGIIDTVVDDAKIKVS